MTSGNLVPGLSFCQDSTEQGLIKNRSRSIRLSPLPSFSEALKLERRAKVFPDLLIGLELYAIVIGLSLALFVFLARERLRRLKENGDADGQPLLEGKHRTPNPFARASNTF